MVATATRTPAPDPGTRAHGTRSLDLVRVRFDG